MKSIYGFITCQGETQVFSMSSFAWTLDLTGRLRNKRAKVNIEPQILDKKIYVLDDENFDEWIEARADMIVDADSLHDEILDRGGNLSDSMDLLPAIWININNKTLYQVESVAEDENFENYLPEGWLFASLAKLEELAELLPEQLCYWLNEDILDFEGDNFSHEYIETGVYPNYDTYDAGDALSEKPDDDYQISYDDGEDF